MITPGPVFRRLPGTTVARLSTDVLWMLAPMLSNLTKASDWPNAGETHVHLASAERWVQAALDSPGMETCRTAGDELLSGVRQALELCKSAPSPTLISRVLALQNTALAGSARRLDTVIRDTLKRMQAFVPDVSGLLKDERLVASAHECVDADLRAGLTDDVRRNLDQAGRALVFDLPTASAFHVSRAIESVAGGFCRSTAEALPFPVDPKQWQLGRYCSLLSQRILGSDPPWRAHQFDGDPRKSEAAPVVRNLWALKDGNRDVVTHEANEWYGNEKAVRYFTASVASICDLLREQCDRKWSTAAP